MVSAYNLLGKLQAGGQDNLFLKDAKEGETVTFDQVLLVGDKETVVGQPLGVGVEAVVKQQTRNPKIIVFKFKG